MGQASRCGVPLVKALAHTHQLPPRRSCAHAALFQDIDISLAEVLLHRHRSAWESEPIAFSLSKVAPQPKLGLQRRVRLACANAHERHARSIRTLMPNIYRKGHGQLAKLASSAVR
jgi:hypothetical protein